MMMIPVLPSKPSISVRSWFKVCSRSSLPPPRPAPRCRPTASISSMNTMQGAFFLACSNRSRTRLAPTPTNISTNSEPEIEKKGTPASPATAFASSVLPVPGGPTSKQPLGIFAPTAVKRSGFLRKSTTSVSSSLAPSIPATSPKVTCVVGSIWTRALLLPKFMAWFPPPPPPPWARRNRKNRPPRSSSGKIKLVAACCQAPGWREGCTAMSTL
mmetsp:Transcript_75151/g.176431  ORF Transcript_75151/g.176431 Transcript_75151/m.176431 type:complete len:214 (-) Transcript_75151:276-917(-)